MRVWLIGLGLGAAIAWGGTAAAQQAQNLETLLESYGFRLQQEDGRRFVKVTLRQVLALALQRNLSLQSVRIGEQVAASGLRSARERLNPTLDNSLDYQRGWSPSLFFSPGTNFLSLTGTDTLTWNSTLTKPTESGVEYSLSYSEQRIRPLANSIPAEGEDPAGATTGDWLGISALTGAVNIPLAQDFGFDINNLPVRRGEADVTGSRLTTRERELTLVEVTASTYWDLVAALENVRVQQDAVTLSTQLLEDNRQRLAAGVVSPFDVQVVEAQLARERERLLTARATVLRIEDLARALLNLQVVDFEVVPQDRPDVHAVSTDYPELLRRVYEHNPRVKQLENRLHRNNLDLLEARNRDRADLDLSLFYTLQGFSRDPLGGTSGFAQTELDEYGATLTWSVPLWDVATEESIRKRMLERQQLELELSNLKSDLNVRLQGVLRQDSITREQVTTAGIARDLAEEQLRNEIERFGVGESTAFQVSELQQDAAEAQVQEILARLAFERNFLQLLVLTGDIYEHYGLASQGASP